jgi:hypothetical protein
LIRARPARITRASVTACRLVLRSLASRNVSMVGDHATTRLGDEENPFEVADELEAENDLQIVRALPGLGVDPRGRAALR